MKLPLLLGGAAAAMFFTTAHGHVHLALPCHLRLMPIRCTAKANPAADDVDKVVDAAYADQLDETLAHLYTAVNRAQAAGKGTVAWAYTIEHEVPGLAQRAAAVTRQARARVAAVHVQTATGRRFRAMALHALNAQGFLYAAFAHDLLGRQPTVKAFNRWGARLNALHRWLVGQVASIAAAAPPADRAAVVAALQRY